MNEKTMTIKNICERLKTELVNNGYEYGFCLNGKTYKPDISKGFDTDFYNSLLNDYRVQAPCETKAHKVGTCNDIVVLMKSILDEQNVPNRIWLLHNSKNGSFHTVLTFEAENKTVYLELTPQSQKPWYGEEIIFESEKLFIKEYSKDGCEVIDITDEITVGEKPEFILRRQ